MKMILGGFTDSIGPFLKEVVKFLKLAWKKAIWPAIKHLVKFLVWWVILLIPRGIWTVIEYYTFTSKTPLHDKICGFFTIVSIAILTYVILSTGHTWTHYAVAGGMVILFGGTWIWGRPK